MSPSPLAWLGLAALPLFACAQDDGTPSVTITASKDAVVRKVDKTVVDVSTTARAQNGTAQDVLQSTPELSVAADGTISVRGNANVTVLVDGKPSAMLAGDERAVALQTINGADIASVEVITNPSAAYHANGGAIVNLVLKRQRQPGAHAQWRAGPAAPIPARKKVRCSRRCWRAAARAAWSINRIAMCPWNRCAPAAIVAAPPGRRAGLTRPRWTGPAPRSCIPGCLD